MTEKNQIDTDEQVSAGIDFLPARFHEQYARRRSVVWRITIVAAFATALPIASLYQFRMRLGVQNELAVVQRARDAIFLDQKKLDIFQKQLAREAAEAQLVTWLDHPWPRSRIIAAMVASMPDSITLESMEIFVEPVGGKAAVGQRRETEAAVKEGGKPLPGQRDQQEIRRRYGEKTIVRISGRTTDNRQLHQYLATLEHGRLFDKADLDSVERQSGNGGRSASARFEAVIFVTPSYGQSGGPQQAPRPIAGNLVSRISEGDAS